MTSRTTRPLVALLIRIGLLLALAILLMVEKSQTTLASPNSPQQMGPESRLDLTGPRIGTHALPQSLA